ARLGVARTGVPPAAEGELNLGSDGRGVDIDYAAGQITLGPCGPVDVAAVDGRGETERDAVGDGDGLVQRRAGEHTHHRAEDLLPGDAHDRRDVTKDRG